MSSTGAGLLRKFENQTTQPKVKKQMGKKGRCGELIANRNNKIICRYYYYARLLQLRTDKVFEHLQQEFDLTERTLFDIVSSRQGEISKMFREETSLKDISKKYPYYNWSV
jgi:hypothetical protein